MARSKARVVMNHKGSRELLRSAKVQADLKRRASAIAAAAGAGHEADVEVGPNRARAQVTTVTFAARRAEARHHTLLSALDAGRS